MGAVELRSLISEYVNTADERLLKIVKAVMESYHEDEFTITEEQYKIIDQRRERHLKGKSKSFTWEEVKQSARDVSQ
ncbi:addiction module protein [Aquimarina sp. I32.4]|uniref:addiction module protein n=1 Tax=Aquimarina sp. I32.4 TaxID=2053903 RepID=UPI001E39AF74|nr:addiction module protein [Aquimarina sp. I32.4]